MSERSELFFEAGFARLKKRGAACRQLQRQQNRVETEKIQRGNLEIFHPRKQNYHRGRRQ